MIITIYLHSSKEYMYEKGKEAGLKGTALDFFMYACCEVKIDLAVEETGHARIFMVDDRVVRP